MTGCKNTPVFRDGEDSFFEGEIRPKISVFSDVLSTDGDYQIHVIRIVIYPGKSNRRRSVIVFRSSLPDWVCNGLALVYETPVNTQEAMISLNTIRLIQVPAIYGVRQSNKKAGTGIATLLYTDSTGIVYEICDSEKTVVYI